MRSVLYARECLDNCPVCSVFSGPNLSKGRNLMVSRFLETGADWLYITDTDMMFANDTIERLAAHGEPVMSALCLTGSENPVPSMFEKAPGNEGAFMPITRWFTNVVLDVDVVGSACLLVHRDVFTKVESQLPNPAAQWFQEVQVGDNLVGEDFTFCERAVACGFQVKVDTSVQVGHIKAAILGEVT